MSDAFWLHFYGSVTVLALLIALWPIIRPRILAFSSSKRLQKKLELEDELSTFKLCLSEDKYMNRWFHALLSRALSWLTAGIATGIWGLANYGHESEIYKMIVFSTTSICFGSALGSFLILQARTKRFLDPEKTIYRLENRISKLN